ASSWGRTAAYSRLTRKRKCPSVRSPAVSAPGRCSQNSCNGVESLTVPAIQLVRSECSKGSVIRWQRVGGEGNAKLAVGGATRSRTEVDGFAIRCIATLPLRL